MEVKKENGAPCGGAVTEEELAYINRLAKKEMKAEEVYSFAVRLCDNGIDRDGERFPRATLEELAALFVGKSGLFDHEWSAHAQAARIYRTEIVEEEGKTETGERRAYLKGYAYMLRTEANAELIAEIEGGIKKEVSVGCSVERCVCSICGQEMGACAHEKGKRYGGRVCCGELVGAQDAYEWSFVAVPAQPRAGVIKRRGGEETLRALVQRSGAQKHARELERLEKEAALGRGYLAALRTEVRRLMLTAEEGCDGRVIETMTEKLDEDELRELEHIYRARTEKKLGLRTQLRYGARGAEETDESDFRI